MSGFVLRDIEFNLERYAARQHRTTPDMYGIISELILIPYNYAVRCGVSAGSCNTNKQKLIIYVTFYRILSTSQNIKLLRFSKKQ